jgi:hypothetical protein
MVSVIFLDIDGVLNTYKEHGKYGHNYVDPEKIKIVEKIVSATGAKIVISSNWRFDMDFVRKSLPTLASHIIGNTGITGNRISEIEEWMEGKEIDSYVVIDDLLLLFPDNLVHINDQRGITIQDAAKAINILNRSKVEKLACLFEKLAAVNVLKTYHGTSVYNLQSIAEKGLGLDNNLYLTNDIETAAYYAAASDRNKNYPVILEIVIHGASRIKNILHDEMDREHLAGGEFGEPRNQWEEDLYQLRSAVKHIAEELNLNYSDIRFLENIIDLDDDLSKINGLNIYKELIAFARTNNIDVNKIKQLIQKYLPVGSISDHLEITANGTIKTTADYYDAMHQMIYLNKLPVKTIKAIWAPEKQIRPLFKKLASEKKQFGYKILSGDVGHLRDKLQRIDGKIYYSKTPEEMLRLIEEIKEYDEFGIIETKDLEEAAKAGNKTEILDILSWISNEDLQYGAVAGEQNWLKFELGRIGLGLNRVIDLYENKEID